MGISAEQLSTQLTETMRSGGAGHGDGDPVYWLWPVLLRELARGRPVTVDDLARVTGRAAVEVRAGLGALSDTEYDHRGSVVGHGITLRETPHQFTVDGLVLHTWCALDTLIFPTVLDRPAQVVSPTPGTGELVRLRVDPTTGVTELDPDTAVVSVFIPDAGVGVRSAFCNQVRFFATPVAARGWLTEHPGGRGDGSR